MAKEGVDVLAGLQTLIAEAVAAKSKELDVRVREVEEREKKVELVMANLLTPEKEVRLRVGNRSFVTTTRVLTSQKDSFFCGLIGFQTAKNASISLSGAKDKGDTKESLKEVKDGHQGLSLAPLPLPTIRPLDDEVTPEEVAAGKTTEFFIPRDGDMFAYVLEFLTYGELLTLPNEPGMARKLAIDADYYLLPNLKKALEDYGTKQRGTRGANNGPVVVYSTNHQVTSGFKNWNISLAESKGVMTLQNDSQTFVSDTGGTYRISVRVNGQSSGANSDHIALYIDGSSRASAYVGLNTGYYCSFHLNEIVVLTARQRVQVYQQINSNNLAGQVHNSISIERLV